MSNLTAASHPEASGKPASHPWRLSAVSGGPMSSFDPPLSRFTAAMLTLGALAVCAWVFHVAYATTAKPAVSTMETMQP